MKIEPIEKTDPELANYIYLIANGKFAAKISGTKVFKTMYPRGPIVYEVIGDKEFLPKRNETCFCGSSNKYKKCCINGVL